MACPHSTLSFNTNAEGELTARLGGELIDANAHRLLETLATRIRERAPSSVVLDVSDVDAIEQPGFDGIVEIEDAAVAVNANFRVMAAGGSSAAVLRLVNNWRNNGR